MLLVKGFQLTEQIQLDRHVPIALRLRPRIDYQRAPGHYAMFPLHNALEAAALQRKRSLQYVRCAQSAY